MAAMPQTTTKPIESQPMLDMHVINHIFDGANLSQSYLSGLESGRMGSPSASLGQRLGGSDSHRDDAALSSRYGHRFLLR